LQPKEEKEEIKVAVPPKAEREEIKAMVLPKPEKEKIKVEIAKPQVEEKAAEELKTQTRPEPPVMEEIKAGRAMAPVKIEIAERAGPETNGERPSAPELVNARPSIAAAGQSSGIETWLVAKKGDTLSKLSVDVYGRVDERILYTLKRKNPSISNIHLIAVGQEIYFPPARALEEESR